MQQWAGCRYSRCCLHQKQKVVMEKYQTEEQAFWLFLSCLLNCFFGSRSEQARLMVLMLRPNYQRHVRKQCKNNDRSVTALQRKSNDWKLHKMMDNRMRRESIDCLWLFLFLHLVLFCLFGTGKIGIDRRSWICTNITWSTEAYCCKCSCQNQEASFHGSTAECASNCLVRFNGLT